MTQTRPWTSDAHARPRPHTFYPPKNNRFVIGVVQRLLPADMRRKLKVTEVAMQSGALDRLQQLKGERCLLTPSHSGGYEPHIMLYLSKLLGEDFNFLAALELFEQSPLQRWLLQRLGVYSILRGAVDRPSFEMTRKLLAGGQRPLVIFPEGETIWQGSTVMPFQQGVFQLAFKAFEDAQKIDAEASLLCVPIAIRYVYLADMSDQIEATLARLEAQLSIPAGAKGDSCYLRMRRAAEAVLAANERFHNVKPAEGLKMDERIQFLKLNVIERMERDLAISPRDGEPILNRIRSLFNEVDRIVFDKPPASEYEQHLAAQRQQAARNQYHDLWRLLRFVAIYDGYVGESMTVERYMDVLGLMDAEVFGRRHAWGPRQARVDVGEPIDLRDRYTAYIANKRGEIADVTLAMESVVGQMLSALEADGKILDVS